MKRLLLALIAVVMALTAFAQTDSASYMARFNDLSSAYEAGNYQHVIDEGEGLAVICDSLNLACSDSSYVSIQTFLGKSYFRTKRPLDAAKAADKACRRLEKMGWNDCLLYADMLDNAGLYYLSAKQNDIGLERSKKALGVISTIPDAAVSNDMSVILQHIAEGSFFTGKYDDAIIYEIRALNIIEKIYGKHSKEYIDELSYLSEYYRAAKEDAKADDNDAEIKSLQAEYDNGMRDLPDADNRDFSSAEECHKYKYEVYRCADYVLTHSVRSKYINQCLKYMMIWTIATDEVSVTFDKNEAKLVEKDNTKPYFVAYLAACIKYALDKNDSTFSQDMYIEAITSMLNYYINNRDLTGKVAYMEKYIALYDKGEEKLFDALRKNYARLTKQK